MQFVFLQTVAVIVNIPCSVATGLTNNILQRNGFLGYSNIKAKQHNGAQENVIIPRAASRGKLQ